MGWFNWFRRTKPIVAEVEDKSPFEQAKEILSQSNKKEDIISQKMEEATIELEKFEEADIVEGLGLKKELISQTINLHLMLMKLGKVVNHQSLRKRL